MHILQMVDSIERISMAIWLQDPQFNFNVEMKFISCSHNIFLFDLLDQVNISSKTKQNMLTTRTSKFEISKNSNNECVKNILTIYW